MKEIINHIEIKFYQPADNFEIAKLFYETVHTVAAKDYTKPQLDAWAPKTILETNLENWCQGLLESYALVAEFNRKIVGFANLKGNYLDRLFVHKDFQSMGVGGRLLQALEKRAAEEKQNFIIGEVSKTAKSFFEKYGYYIIKSQRIKREEVILENFVMKKILN